MNTPEVRKQYTTTVGIECHVQLKTATKLFSATNNDAREAPPNTLVSHIDFGLPGALPVLNKEAVHLAARAAFALGTVPQKFSTFDRKHYFYPDLPKGYQITQFDQPTVVGGSLVITLESGEEKTIGITRAHIEEDAGKSTHPAGKDYSLVDLNRAGTPLLEIVSEAAMHSPEEAKLYARELYLCMKYADISDANLYYGNMRFDVNVSVSKTAALGTRTETKNINSFRAVEKVVAYETDRQIAVLEKGGSIVQETRGWDDAKQRTFTQRTKENADDYRYMPEPDVPPIMLDDAYIEQVRAELPVMPQAWRVQFRNLGLDAKTIERIIETQADAPELQYLEFVADNLSDKDFAKWLTNRIVNVLEPLRLQNQLVFQVRWAEFFPPLYALSCQGQLSSTKEKELMEELLKSETLPADIAQYAKEHGFIQVSDEAEIARIVTQVLSENVQAAQDVRQGETKAIGFLVGQVMKASKGKANPQLAQELIKKHLHDGNEL